jgi:hypothetical protein
MGRWILAALLPSALRDRALGDLDEELDARASEGATPPRSGAGTGNRF